ncbi:MAG: 3-deoxy-D-manno-octulosonic acid transferase [Alphaproteobacteria bacterium]|jgi:3-deoxy-D-manno-octulosonic-acid transferase|nr:3-deoxy-D-manno-octulosonic acid transferase [Alphaproteobacteria bacterium]MBT5389510.1 3-deoxy-D-manno-octulosonic acid transferase [Alphaproteobacteria bacterium]MBT5541165.1 3-deoxy-D-manno-octulosonic acid transferase [Alphaproteobacteria bacterium]MBT5654284.1 3-deoxy-D-manno-octulosonic acid transferase [Alphaproteobacteria bacterium]
MKPVIRLYRFVVFLLSPILWSVFLWRKFIGKEDKKRFKERKGIPSLEKPSGHLIWIHAASVGESLSILSLINRLLEIRPTCHILLTTGTVTSAALMKSRLPDRAFHQYIPIDRVRYVRRFLRHWRPNLILWVESELWPNLVHESHDYGVPMVLVNARLSDRSFKGWRRFKFFAEDLLQCFKISLAQSKETAQKLKALGAQHIRVPGNLKFGAAPLPVDPEALAHMNSTIGKRPVWLAASTHEGEEEQIAATHLALKKEIPHLLTLIVPRHPERGIFIQDTLSSMGLSVALRSDQKDILPDTDIYVADTLGELGLFYRLSPIVFMGGSLVPTGGHNPLEPAMLDSALLWGPHTHNFRDMIEKFHQENAAICVNSSEELAKELRMLFSDASAVRTLETAARNVAKSENDVLDRVILDIEPYLPKTGDSIISYRL